MPILPVECVEHGQQREYRLSVRVLEKSDGQPFRADDQRLPTRQRDGVSIRAPERGGGNPTADRRLQIGTAER
ncbi:MAG: hypothetical protein EXR98_22205 [Gemmataceae bacterium]|nr:hypothetical protein [Gemmataceae bacterium]